MEFITRKMLADSAPKRWSEEYANWSHGDDKHKVTAALNALKDDERTPDRTNAIIGNDSWTLLECDECQAEVDEVVTVGEPEDHGGRTANICVDCAIRALEEFGGLRPMSTGER